MRADVGVGQGSALSPILSALYLVPVMHIFEQRIAVGQCTLISYVNDGSLIVQSAEWGSNLTKLQQAYAVINKLVSALGLVLEHDKTEVFHFSRKPNDENPSIDLQFAPYTGDTVRTAHLYPQQLCCHGLEAQAQAGTGTGTRDRH
jgi:hypothetical protein